MALQIHYGRASLSPLSRLPTYFVFGRQPLDVSACAHRIADYCATSPNLQGVPAVVVVPDEPYAHASQWLHGELQALTSKVRYQIPLMASILLASVITSGVFGVWGDLRMVTNCIYPIENLVVKPSQHKCVITCGLSPGIVCLFKVVKLARLYNGEQGICHSLLFCASRV